MMAVQGPLCVGCPLEYKGTIWIPFDGVGTNRVMLVGDSGWEWEARNVRTMSGQRVGTPFSGPSGWWMERNLWRIGQERSNFIIANSYWCKTPHLGFTDRPDRHPEAALALEHCRPYLHDLITRMQPKAIVPLGNVALRCVTGLSGIEKHHAYYIPTAYGIPAIPAFHPRYILQGNQNLSGVWCYAIQRALAIAQRDERPRQYELLLDPSLDAAMEYLTQYNDLLVCDIETPESKDEGEDELEKASHTIVRVSFNNRAGTAISMPWQPPYVKLAQEVLAGAKQVVFWNQSFDLPRLKANGCEIHGKVIDAMLAWHWLQSDLPKALGFVAPLFMCIEPWKQLSAQEPARYSALDSAITMDCYLAIRRQLEADGRWEMFERHCIRVLPIFERVGQAGVMLDKDHQMQFKAKLETERDGVLQTLQNMVPDEVKPLKVYKTKSNVRLPFNPSSPKQVKDLIHHLGLSIPRVRGEDRESTEAKFLKPLARKNKIFQLILDYRERAKLINTYMWKGDLDGRVRTTFGFHPSTWRKSARNPNVQTIPKRNDLASDFRRCVVAGHGNLLVECDSSGIEAVLVGFYAGSQRYIELARGGVHKWLAEQYAGRRVDKNESLYDQIKRVVHLSNYVGTPHRIVEEYPDLFMPSDEVVAKLKEKVEKGHYTKLLAGKERRVKLSPHEWSAEFDMEVDRLIQQEALRSAKNLQDFYFGTDAGQDVRRWQQQTLKQAHKEHYLEIPWKYRHYFYDVFHSRNGQMIMGDDAKRAVAFKPQATASAIQTEFLLDIEENHGWMAPYLRWIVHDSIIAEVPKDEAEEFACALRSIMQQPFALLGGLWVGAEAKVGPNLRDMEVVA